MLTVEERKGMKRKKNVFLILAAVIAVIIMAFIFFYITKIQTGRTPYEGYDLTSYVNLADYEAIIEEKKSEDLTDDEKNQILQEIIIQSEILKYPEKETEKWKQLYDQYYRGLAEDYQSEDFTEFVSQMLGMTKEEYEEFLEAEAKQTVAEELCIYEIAEEKEVEVTDEEYKKFVENTLKQMNLTEEEFDESYGKSIYEYAEENGIRTQLLKEKVINKFFGGK